MDVRQGMQVCKAGTRRCAGNYCWGAGEQTAPEKQWGAPSGPPSSTAPPTTCSTAAPTHTSQVLSALHYDFLCAPS